MAKHIYILYILIIISLDYYPLLLLLIPCNPRCVGKETNFSPPFCVFESVLRCPLHTSGNFQQLPADIPGRTGVPFEAQNFEEQGSREWCEIISKNGAG